MAGINPEVTFSGKLFERPETTLNYHMNLMSTKLAKEAQRAIRFQGTVSFQYLHSQPTGNWANHVRVNAVAGGLAQVTDSGIVYGPWLEGVGSRNYPVTRFKGYHTFRKVTQEIERKAPQMLAPDAAALAKDLES